MNEEFVKKIYETLVEEGATYINLCIIIQK